MTSPAPIRTTLARYGVYVTAKEGRFAGRTGMVTEVFPPGCVGDVNVRWQEGAFVTNWLHKFNELEVMF